MKSLHVVALILAGSRLPAQEPGRDLTVYLMTMGPGAEIYERFGHNAVWIHDAAAHSDLIYNYGTFEIPGGVGPLLNFGVKFMMGPPRYWLGVDHSLDHALGQYQYFKRDMDAQELNFTPAQRADLARRLAANALDANRYYAYDYFRDNCSTRVRDMLDLELGGALRRATVGKPAEGTLRFHTRRSITNDKLLFVGIDAAFGPRVDRPLDQWDEMFLPAKVAERIAGLTVAGADGRAEPLVIRHFSLLTIGAYHVDPKPPQWTGAFLVIGLAIAGLIRLTDSRRVTSLIGRAVGGVWMLLTGIGGLVLLFFWIFTQHVATWGNHNLLFLSPLALLLVRSFWFRAGRTPGPWPPRVAMVLMASVTIGTALALLPALGGQQNQLIAALTVLPTFIAALEALRRSNRRTADNATGPDHPPAGPVAGV